MQECGRNALFAMAVRVEEGNTTRAENADVVEAVEPIITINSQNVTRAGNAGGGEAVVAAILRHKGSSNVNACATLTLFILTCTSASPENVARSSKAGAVEAVVLAAACRHPSSAVNFVVEAMMIHAEHAGVQ